VRTFLSRSLATTLLLGTLAAQAQQTVSPAAFSQGEAGNASGLESQAWWQSFGDATLDGLVRRATEGSLTLQQAQARILQARATLGSAKADQWPSVTASASMNRSDTSDNATSPSVATSATTLYQAGFDASWEVDLFGGKRKTKEAAQARYEASVEDLHAARLTLAGDVATNYIALRSNQALLEITRRNAETQRQTVTLTGERHRLGLISGLDVAQARAQLAATTAEIPSLEASIRQSIHRISLLLGQEPTALVEELSAAKPLPSAQGNLATGLPSELLERRPDLRSAERNLKAAMADIGAARAELYPRFDLTFGLGLQSTQTSTFASISSRYGSIIPGLSLPIFNRGALKANVAKKEAVYQEALAAFRASYHTALEDVENALSNYYAEKGRRQDLEESLAQSQQALALAQERYQRGLTSFLNVLTAQSSVQEAQRSLSQSEARVLTHLVSLHKALGGGWSAA
jgi:NodT family efflux transporter outer membrane factor (OMF) lipoprotein